MNFTLIQGGDLYSPQPQGQQSLLLAGNQIAKVGVIDPQPLLAADVDLTVVDATGCVVVPGFIDPHEHLIGAGGEAGFASRMPEILASQILTAGITTVIGLLGTDTVTRHLASLHAKASQLWAEGITAYFYTGGFELPPSTLAGSLMNDLVMIDKVIGAGEIAISDQRWVDPQLDPLAHVVTETRVGGMMSGQAGVTHFHVGPGKKRLALLHELLDNYDIPPASLYPTHINRNEALIDDGIALAKRGAYNALAATAAAWAAGLNPAMIVRALTTFATDPQTTPGRFNVLDLNGVEVIVDYGHNVAALEALGEAVHALPLRSTVMSLTLPGDRRDEDIIASTNATIPYVDAYVVYDSADRRGRAVNEVAELICRHIPADLPCEVVIGQQAGILQAWQRVKSGDRLLVICDDVPTALALLHDLAQCLQSEVDCQSPVTPDADGHPYREPAGFPALTGVSTPGQG